MTAKRQWTLATALVCLLVLVAGFLLLAKPQHSKAASIRTQTAGVNNQITTLRAQLAMLQEESKNIATQQAALFAIEQQLPSGPQLPTLLVKLDAAAAKEKVTLTNVAPGQPAAYSYTPVVTTTPSAGATAAPTPAAAATVPGLADIPVSLAVSGNYSEIEGFLDDLEGLQRSMLVNTFSLTGGGGTSTSSTTSTPNEITATINAEVFMATTALGSTTSTPSASS
jgi:Tfp pilus assembly protein PilO